MCAETVDWRSLGPLPVVSPWHRGKRSLTWVELRDAYAALPKQALIITAELATPVVHAEAHRTHLDSVLSSAALTAHPVASSFEGQVCSIPLPLELAWVSPTGQPLWVCSPLMPVGESVVSREYWHKRYPSHRAELGDKLSADTSAGRYREYRMPIHAEAISSLHAVCIGHQEEIDHLLRLVTHIGKKASMGYGRVVRWTVTPSDHTREDVLSMRAVPKDFLVGSDEAISPPRGWTPPYWYAPWWLPCRVPA